MCQQGEEEGTINGCQKDIYFTDNAKKVFLLRER